MITKSNAHQVYLAKKSFLGSPAVAYIGSRAGEINSVIELGTDTLVAHMTGPSFVYARLRFFTGTLRYCVRTLGFARARCKLCIFVG